MYDGLHRAGTSTGSRVLLRHTGSSVTAVYSSVSSNNSVSVPHSVSSASWAGKSSWSNHVDCSRLVSQSKLKIHTQKQQPLGVMKTSVVVVVVNMLKSWIVILGLTSVLVFDSVNGVNLAPVFDQNMNQHRIKENTPVGSVIYTLSGTDPEGSTVRYGLSGKNV